MKISLLPLAAAVALAAPMLSAMAQKSASAPLNGASAPAATKPRPRLLTPTEMRDSATVPGELRPRSDGTPQLSIPLGKTPSGQPKPKARVVRPGMAASGGIDDSVARCEAQSDEQARAKCRAELARQGRSR